MEQSRFFEKAKMCYFLLVAATMYYFLNEYIDLGFHVTYRHAFALLLFASAVLLFLYKPNIARGLVSVEEAVIYSAPMLVTITVSLFIWFVGTVETDVISRGISTAMIYTNMLSAALGAGALLYVFGKKGIWYNLVAILAANILVIVTIIAQHGLGSYLSEFITLIATFAGETGEIIVQAEVHELAFCLGAYLIYMLYKPQKNVVYFILLALNVFCFLSAFKRIAMIAIVIALAFGYLLKFIARFNKKTAAGLLIFLELAVVLILIGYIVLIKLDTFALLEKAGINTSGRVGIYNAVDDLYEFSPTFLGNGIGFLTYRLNTDIKIGVGGVHNDFLQHYIDLGFWGYIIWLLSMTVFRACHFGKNGNVENAIIAFMLTLYLIVASSTDNTMNYPLLTGTLAILMMGHSYDDKVRKREEKLLGCVSKENKKGERDSLL